MASQTVVFREATVVAPEQIKSLSHISGSKEKDFTNVLINQAINTTLNIPELGEAYEARQRAAVLLAMSGIAPKDELEGMLGAQMIGLHNAAMEALRRAMLPHSVEVQGAYINQANKLTRSYAKLLDALNRHRGKGQQKVTVEHVHVHPGGQAIVGNLSRPEGGIKEK